VQTLVSTPFHKHGLTRHSRKLSFLRGREPAQNDVNHHLLADRRIHHQVKKLARWPVDSEMFLDEPGPIRINVYDQLHRLRLALALALQAMHLVIERCVDESVKGVFAVVQVIGRAAPDDDSVASQS
jgi:hypothetical protein